MSLKRIKNISKFRKPKRKKKLSLKKLTDCERCSNKLSTRIENKTCIFRFLRVSWQDEYNALQEQYNDSLT